METYGCQMNVADSSEVRYLLERSGWHLCPRPQDADLVIINTCSVRKTAEDRVHGRLGFYKNLKSKKDFKLVVMGCFAQKDGESLQNAYPFIDFVIGTQNKQVFHDFIDSAGESAHSLHKIHTSMDNHFDFMTPAPDPTFPRRSFFSVIKGCNNFCSYCIVPYTRGREVSLPSEEIIREITKLSERGVQEVVLLGQNVNSYGLDTKDISFAQLLTRLADIPQIKRLKFMTSHPKDFSEELIDVVTSLPKISQYVHLPVQSGSNTVLKSMNRHYTREHYLKIVDSLRKKAPEISLSTDLLLGFPGEREEDFQATYNLVKEVNYDKAFIFMYSPREGTASEHLPETVSPEEKKLRVQKIIELQNTISAERLKRFVGRTLQVLTENSSKKDKTELLGLSEYETRVVFPGRIQQIGQFLPVSITGIKGLTLLGEVVS